MRVSIRKPAGKYNVKIMKNLAHALVHTFSIARAHIGAIGMIHETPQIEVGRVLTFCCHLSSGPGYNALQHPTKCDKR